VKLYSAAVTKAREGEKATTKIGRKWTKLLQTDIKPTNELDDNTITFLRETVRKH